MIAWLAAPALAGPFLQVGTGHRPLDVPLTDTLFGGGGRVGWDFGVVAPFVGGTATLGSINIPDNDQSAEGVLWSLAAGARVDLPNAPEAATPYLAAGLSFGKAAGRIDDDDNGDTIIVGVGAGPGAFGGFGAEATVIPNFSLGLEVGAHYAWSRIFYQESFGNGVDTYEAPAYLLFGYADLHATFTFGGDR